MEIICQHCQSRFKLADDKVPRGKAFTLTCPKCKQKVTVAAEEPAATPSLFDEISSGGYDAAERPFDFIEQGAKTAIICENDPEYHRKIVDAIKDMDYYITVASSARDVLKRMRFHTFDLVVINERFDTPDPERNNILRYLERLPMTTRRDMFVALVTDRFRTMDSMEAFHKSVNLIVNVGNLDALAKILRRGISDNDNFYRVFKEGLVRAGRA